jgi:hypothetical protein
MFMDLTESLFPRHHDPSWIYTSKSSIAFVAVGIVVGSAVLTGVIVIIIFMRRNMARNRNPATHLVATKPTPSDVDTDFDLLVCEPPSSSEIPQTVPVMTSGLTAGGDCEKVALSCGWGGEGGKGEGKGEWGWVRDGE